MIKLSLGRTRDVAVVANVRLKRRSAGSLVSAPLTELYFSKDRLLRPWRYLQIDFISDQVGIRSSRISHADAPADALAIGGGFG